MFYDTHGTLLIRGHVVVDLETGEIYLILWNHGDTLNIRRICCDPDLLGVGMNYYLSKLFWQSYPVEVVYGP